VICHSCRSDALALLIRVDQQGIPPGEDGHDIAYSHTVVFACAHCRGSEIEVHAHDCFDHEDVFDQYDWYLLDPSDTWKLLALLERCPARLSADCGCAVHVAFRTSCQSLPSSARQGRRDVDADFHVHRASLDVNDGLPRIAREPNGSR
jgi:hypothetical protein